MEKINEAVVKGKKHEVGGMAEEAVGKAFPRQAWWTMPLFRP